MGLDVTKPVSRFSNKVRFKPVFSATETSWNIEISLEASLDMILSAQSAWMHRLVCAFVVRLPPKTYDLIPNQGVLQLSRYKILVLITLLSPDEVGGI